MFANPPLTSGISFMDDSQTQIWRIPLVLAQERCEDREEKESGNVLLASCREETRASGAVFQEALIFVSVRVEE
jgi:hypothetical protein